MTVTKKAYRTEHPFEIPKRKNPLKYVVTKKTNNNNGHFEFYAKLYSKGHWKRTVRRVPLFGFPILK